MLSEAKHLNPARRGSSRSTLIRADPADKIDRRSFPFPTLFASVETSSLIISYDRTPMERYRIVKDNAYVIMPMHLHAILFDTKFNSDRLKHTLEDMRKFTGRLLVEHAALHLPKIYMEVLKENAGKDRQHRFWQPTRHPVGLLTEIVWQQKMEYLHDNPCRKGLVKSPEDYTASDHNEYYDMEVINLKKLQGKCHQLREF